MTMTDIMIERAYLTAGGDLENATGKELFRLDVENHGKTAAFMTAYSVQFATLAELREEPVMVARKAVRYFDGISPLGGRRQIQTQLEQPKAADAVLGAVWYEDVFGGEHLSRFLLRIAPHRDIPKHGLTRLDVDESISSQYWART